MNNRPVRGRNHAQGRGIGWDGFFAFSVKKAFGLQSVFELNKERKQIPNPRSAQGIRLQLQGTPGHIVSDLAT